jgi:hypothetical protein
MNWRTSSYSGQGGGNCVEAASRNGEVLVRDTKARERGQVVTVDALAWSRFTEAVKASRLRVLTNRRAPVIRTVRWRVLVRCLSSFADLPYSVR